MLPFFIGETNMPMQDKIALASAACVLLGADQIQSFDEETTEALAARVLYENVYGSLLKHRNWSFAKKVIQLSELQKEAEYGYKYVYRINVDAIKVIAVDNQVKDYKLVSLREIHTADKCKTANVLFKPDEALLPEDFKLALTYMLAAAFAPIVTDDSSQAQRYSSQGALFLKQAAANDAVQSGNLQYRTSSTLLNSHSGSAY